VARPSAHVIGPLATLQHYGIVCMLDYNLGLVYSSKSFGKKLLTSFPILISRTKHRLITTDERKGNRKMNLLNLINKSLD
jgi:hypothetical protein